MKKQLILSILFVAVIFILINACSKSNSNSTTPATKMQLLTQSSWKYDTAGLDNNNDGLIDAPFPTGYGISSCESDNILTLKSDGTGTVDEGATKCNVNDPQTTSFTWSLDSAQTAIVLSDTIFSVISGNVNITSVTATSLHLEKAVPVGPISVNVAFYMKH